MLTLTLKPGKYQHTKSGNFYEVIDIGIHTETREALVVYKSLYPLTDVKQDQLWIRPLSMFTELVDINGEIMPRFLYVG